MKVYVGTFNEQDIDMGIDQIAVAKKEEETGLKYVNTRLVKKKGQIVGIKIWVCDFDDLDLSF